MKEHEYLLELDDIVKVFPGVKALDRVRFALKRGEIHALIGENGAGKSTLMKIVLGKYKNDGGTMRFKGAEYAPKSPADALNYGISMIHQEISLIPTMTVAENIWIGRENLFLKSGLISKKMMIRETGMLLENLGIELNPETRVSNLSVANMQLVEIARAVSYHSDVIIMDEPTSSLTNKEIKILYQIIRFLSKRGTGIIFISHKLEELYEVCDRVTVLRDGHYIATENMKNITQKELIQMMVGRELNEMFPKEKTELGKIILEVKNLGKRGYFENISFKIRKGEIVGFCGLIGAGRTEIMQAIFGYTQPDTGEMYLNGKKIWNHSCNEGIKNGLAMVTEDRLRSGLIHRHSICANITLANLQEYCKSEMINDKKLTMDANRMATQMGVKMANISQEAGMLSGGNQQKVILGKWLLTNPD